MAERDDTITEMLDDERARLKANLTEAVQKLGGIILFRTDAPIIEIVSEDISFVWDETGGHFRVFGVDITSKLQALQINCKSGEFPTFNSRMGNSGVHLRISDEELAQRMSRKKRAG